MLVYEQITSMHHIHCTCALILLHAYVQPSLCNSCNAGTSALPDMYAWRLRASQDLSDNA